MPAPAVSPSPPATIGKLRSTDARAGASSRPGASAAGGADRHQPPQTPDRLAQLATITRDYQVDDDSPATVNYLYSGQYINEAESRVLNDLALKRGVASLWEFRRIQKKALETMAKVVGMPTPPQIPRKVIDTIISTYGRDNLRKYNLLWPRVDGHSDAFRHAYWNALMTKSFGVDFAEAYGASHERLPGNPEVAEAMDLYNNEVGRRIAQQHPGATEDQLAILVRTALRQGKLVVVGQDGKLAWSDMVKWAEHGVTPPASGKARGGKISPLEALPYDR